MFFLAVFSSSSSSDLAAGVKFISELLADVTVVKPGTVDVPVVKSGLGWLDNIAVVKPGMGWLGNITVVKPGMLFVLMSWARKALCSAAMSVWPSVFLEPFLLLFGKPITVRSAPLGRPRFNILGGMVILDEIS